MFGRMSYVSGNATRIDDLITYVRTVVKPATDQLPGNLGLGMWVDRNSGDALVMTVWADQATLLASEQAVMGLRDDAAGIIGGSATVERYENALLDMAAPNQPGQVMRLLRMHCHPAALDDTIAWARANVLPAARATDGYVSYAASVDRESGAISSITTYRDRAAADIALDAMAPIRSASEDRGILIDSITTYEVAIVGIRTPSAVPPAQRSVDLTETNERVART